MIVPTAGWATPPRAPGRRRRPQVRAADSNPARQLAMWTRISSTETSRVATAAMARKLARTFQGNPTSCPTTLATVRPLAVVEAPAVGTDPVLGGKKKVECQAPVLRKMAALPNRGAWLG